MSRAIDRVRLVLRMAGAAGLVAALLAGCFKDSMQGAGTTGASETGETGGTGGTGGTGETGGTADDGPTTTGGAATTGSVDPTTGDGTTSPPCEALVVVKVDAPNVMLVLDKSGSMVSDPVGYWNHDAVDDTPTVTRWRSLYEVVEATIEQFDASLRLGLMLYPSRQAKADYSEAGCVVEAQPEVEVGPTHGAMVLAELPGPDDTDAIAGATPTTTAVKLASAALLGRGSGVMILVTDGAANCAAGAPSAEALLETYDAALPDAVASALEAGIATHVVGVAISAGTTPVVKDGNPDAIDPVAKLNEVAVAGGRPLAGKIRYHDARDQIQLQAAFDQIARELAPCTVKLTPPTDLAKFTISVAGVEYGAQQVTDCATEDGWRFTSDLHDEVALCGAACTAIQATGELAAFYGCPTD